MISKEYKDLLLELRKQRSRWGSTGHKHAHSVITLAEQVKAQSVLDYGAGEQTLKDHVDLEYYAYDPAVPGIDKRPIEECDIAVALDVLEHVEPIYTEAVLEDIWNHAKKGVFLYIPLTEAVAILPDGRNAHINLRPADEWFSLTSKLGPTSIRAEATKRYIKIYLYK